MKKIYCFIVMFLMCFMGTSYAQHQWSPVDGEETSVPEIQAGLDHFYVFKGGANTNAEGEPGNHIGDTQLYLSAGSRKNTITHEAVYNIIETNENYGDYKVYVLKNVSNGMYLVGENIYEPAKAKALKFTIRKSSYFTEADITGDTPWEDYSNAVSDTRSQGAVEMDTWVFCKPGSLQFMCFYGNPAIANYIDTNNWLVIEVKEDELSAYQKFCSIYDKYLSNGVSEDIYPVGSNPGCVDREFYDRLFALSQKADAIVQDPNTADEVCDQVREAIVAIFEELDGQINKVEPGYYIISNPRGGYMWDNGLGYFDRKLTIDETTGVPASWTSEQAKYIWKVENSEEEGRLRFVNFSTKKYLNKSDNHSFPTAAEPNGTYLPSRHHANAFVIHDGIDYLNVGWNGKLTHWGDTNDDSDHFRFFKIDSLVIDSLTEQVNQYEKNLYLAKLIKNANTDRLSVAYKNGYIEEDIYNHPHDIGLVTSFTKVNSFSSSEGSMEAPFDGDRSTFFHTAWKEEDVAAQGTVGHHWVQVDLGKDVSEIILKFSKRNAQNDHISSYELYAPADGDIESEYEMLVGKSADSIAYQYGDSTTHIARYKFEVPVRYLRFVVTSTTGKTKNNQLSKGTGPFWHFSEFRIYDKAECVPNPNYLLIPEEVRANLDAAIEKARAEVKDKLATDETIKMLEDALDAFWKAYPNPSSLKEALESADQMAEYAEESETVRVGWLKVGAKAAFKSVVDALLEKIHQAEETGEALTLKEIDEMQMQFDAAFAEFNSKLYVPANGVYRIVSTAGEELDENGDFIVDEEGNNKLVPQNNSCIAATNADYVNGSPKWLYDVTNDIDERFNTLWYVEKSDEGFSFKNLSNGLYMNNPYEGLPKDSANFLVSGLGYSKTPKHFTLECYAAAHRNAGSFLMNMGYGYLVNLQPGGQHHVVSWKDRTVSHSSFVFSPVSDDDFTQTYNIDVEPGKYQIRTLPINISAVYGKGDVYYVVKGIKDNTLQLTATADPIPAGTPFIVEAYEKENFICLELESASLEDNMNLEYNYSVVEKNGLVSAPVGFETTSDEAYGILFNNEVFASIGNDYIEGGTGFFNNQLPVVTEEGDASIEFEGDITGEGTSIENVVLAKNAPKRVYSVTGVMVRHNAKNGNALQHLPKGVYIVGGKKYIVK